MTVHLVNPSHLSFGIGVITPRWLFVLAAATPSRFGCPQITDETLDPFDVSAIQPGDIVGVGIHTGKSTTAIVDGETSTHRMRFADGSALETDLIVFSAGIRPRDELARSSGLAVGERGGIVIDDHCRTSMRNVWAIGDVTGEPMLAHRAMVQGEMVAEIMAGHRRAFDKVAIPAVCFTDPEIVSVGLSPDAARATGVEIKTGNFPYAANGRAMTMEAEQGFVRVVARADNHLVLGIQAVGQGVSELSASFSLALEMGARLEDISGTIHAHPTLSEALPEAAMKALGLALHA